MSNPYYEPEALGLTLVSQVELSEPSWSFDTLACWADSEGHFYLGTDSGCSCPTPFENYNGLDDLTGPLTAEQAIAESVSLKSGGYESEYDPDGFESYLDDIRKHNNEEE
jgi:hypothetical protein